MRRILTIVLAWVLIAFGPVAAGAVTVIGSGSSQAITPTSEFLYTEFNAATGLQSRSFTFVADAADTPFSMIAATMILEFGEVSDASISWFDGSSTTTASLGDVPGGLAGQLLTIFVGPDKLIQTLSIAWNQISGVSSIQASVQVAQTPIPASIVLLLTALGGTAVLGRRRRLQAA